MTTHREYINYPVTVPKENIYRCRGCGTIYRSAAKNPKCPKGMGRCVGTIQRATRRHVG